MSFGFKRRYLPASHYYIVAGASLYWIAIILYIAHQAQVPSVLGTPDPLVAAASTATVAIIFTLASQVLNDKNRRNVVTAVALLLAVIDILLPYLAQITGAPHSAIARIESCMLGTTTGVLMLFWALHFAFLDMQRAGAAMKDTAFLVLSLYLVVMGTASPVARWFVIRFCVVASCVMLLLLSSQSVPRVREREARHTNKKYFFYLSRVGFGLAMGVVVGLSSSETLKAALKAIHPYSSAIALALGLVIAAAFFLHFAHRWKLEYLFVIPMLAAGTLVLPFLGNDILLLSWLALPTMWVSYMALSVIQVSSYKITFGMSETSLAFSEKAAVMTAWLAAGITGRNIPSLFAGISKIAVTSYTVMILCYVFVFVSTGSIILFVYRSRAAGVTVLSPSSTVFGMTLEDACSAISTQFHLTAREREVLGLLAEGYSIPYVEKTLVIAKGTAKTYANRIYRKLDVHKKEELLDLVKNYMSQGQAIS